MGTKRDNRLGWPIILSLVVMLIAVAQVGAQQPFVFDANGDGVEDMISPGPDPGTWAVYSGASGCGVISVIVEPVPTEIFGHAVIGTPDITGGGSRDVIVLVPTFVTGGETVGIVHVFSALDGHLIWSTVCPTGSYGALGCAVVPDQDKDGHLDLLVRLMDRNNHKHQMTALLSGASGKILRVIDGPMARLAALARTNTLLYAATDLDASASVDIMDGVAFIDMAIAGLEKADVDKDGSITELDLLKILEDADAQVVVAPDDPVPDPGSPCYPITLAEALSLYDPAVVGQYVIADVIGSLQVSDPEITCTPCEVLDDMAFSIDDAVSQSAMALAYPGCVDSRPRPGYTPTSNGCGSGLPSRGIAHCSPWVLSGTFTPCCNAHDICYGTCNSIKSICDANFYACLISACNGLWGGYNRWACRQHAAAFYVAVAYGGQGSYDAAQRAACICCDMPTPDPLCGTVPPPPPIFPPPTPVTPCNPNP